ncbi:transglutaminase-like cysteine peptidase [Falsihalocynthiibacter sp. SS001]|uniref:transglutaminase-like cysteine peptidase n=1 Tax=Falsihalocynthiibacter sp. SS001 TaxID=3349698 RepID=UPI0036D27E49
MKRTANRRHSIVRRIRFAIAVTTCAVSIPFSALAANSHLVATIQIAPPSGAKALCQTYRWACSSTKLEGSKSAISADFINQINTQINRSYKEISDSQQYRTVEHWALPTARGGDCEDFALMKKHKLIRMGIDPKHLLLATVLDRKRNSHAVLIYRTKNGDFVLDNLTNRIRNWQDTGYIFLRMQDPVNPQRWVAGFKSS